MVMGGGCLNFNRYINFFLKTCGLYYGKVYFWSQNIDTISENCIFLHTVHFPFCSNMVTSFLLAASSSVMCAFPLCKLILCYVVL